MGSSTYHCAGADHGFTNDRMVAGHDYDGLGQARIAEVMHRRRMTDSAFADELGIKRLDVSVLKAMRIGTKVGPLSTRVAVDRWLATNSGI